MAESDDLRAYLASQTAAVAGSPEPLNDETPSDDEDTGLDVAMPDETLPDTDDADEGVEAESEGAEPATTSAVTTPAEPTAAEKAATERAEKAEADAAALRQAQNQMYAARAFQQLQERWAGMDPEEAAADKAMIVAKIAASREQALQSENQQLRASIEQDIDVRERRPLVISHITKKYNLTPDQVAVIEDESDPYLMDRIAAKLKSQREVQQKQARANARKARIASGLTVLAHRRVARAERRQSRPGIHSATT